MKMQSASVILISCCLSSTSVIFYFIRSKPEMCTQETMKSGELFPKMMLQMFFTIKVILLLIIHIF